ncbi:MAG: hypothetical protein E7562_06600 [Ruminococcaceae bacterium]|nr:hypothetical protein [Oscillospiraceae bacterium]
MKLRNKIRLISFLTAGSIAVAGLFASQYIKTENYKLKIENEYVSALYELNASLNNIATVSEKIGLVGTPSRLSMLASKLYCEAQIAKSALSRLPLDMEYDRIYLFLSQVGNYALSVSAELMENGKITQNQSEGFLLLSKTASIVANKVDDFQSLSNNPSYWEEELSGILPSDSQSINSTLSETNEQLTDYASLIYNGPFSEHLLDKTPVLLMEAQAVSEKTAEQLLKNIFPNIQFNFTQKTNGQFPQYRFENDTFCASVYENGGYISFVRNQRTVNEELIDYQTALSYANVFLEKMNMYDMTATYYYTENNMCVINFAYMAEGVICYTDLVKVGVALDNGEIIMYEASGYLYNHKQRYFEKQKYSLKEALAKLNSSLTAISSSLVLIPTDAINERLCYEFLCRRESGEEVLIYINANNLIEEQILILLKTNGGTFVR